MAETPRKPRPTKAQIAKAAMPLAGKLMEMEMQLRAAGDMGIGASCFAAGLPVSEGMTMVDAQKFRTNFYKAKPDKLHRLARLLSERNWFFQPVCEMRRSVYGADFSFKGEREWMEDSDYDFHTAHDDALIEFLRAGSVVALWRKNPPNGARPRIEIPEIADVEPLIGIGKEGIRITFGKNAKLSESEKASLGEKIHAAIKTGKPAEITRDDPDWDYAVMHGGKSNEAFPPPPLTSVMDDLDFIECIKVGDWNGAWVRREIIRQTKKGYSTSSGPNAGRTTNNAKVPDLKAILKEMRTIAGKYEMATNFDQEVLWITFAKEFFGSEMIDNSISRLLHWGGLPAVLMLRTESQISGVSSPMVMRFRDEVLAFRKRFARFLSAIFNSPSFRTAFGADMPQKLQPVWSVKPLYSTKELTEILTIGARGYISPQTIRESFLSLNDEEESKLMREATERRNDFIPPFEPNQNLIPARFPADFPGAAGNEPSGNGEAQPGTGAPSNAV
jgi:hypothetical protein